MSGDDQTRHLNQSDPRQSAADEGLTDAGVEPSVDSVGGSYDNVLAETINGLHKTKAIRR